MAEARVRSTAGNSHGTPVDQSREIYPPPVKVGRPYYVEEGATFADRSIRPPLAQRIM
ncbi:excisionase [Paraburkholderia edwinii]|uniref:excisionase n=1 Tax=Paraburkholderia edwinii TaxID=2861782 RepID=UPI001FE80FFC|nr:excisionase [Paraburkholderia edwinii]